MPITVELDDRGVVASAIRRALAFNEKYSKAHKKGISLEERVKVYSEWATTYDQDFEGLDSGPEYIANAMQYYYLCSESDRAKLRILDIAAGTGRVGVALQRVGFTLIDALDPSQGMLDVLSEKGIYDRKFLIPLGIDPIREFLAESYDGLVIVGGFAEGHIPVKALDEMLRIMKPGAMLFIIMRLVDLITVEECKKLEPFLKMLVEKGLFLKISRTVVPMYSFGQPGMVYVFEKL